MAAIDHRTGTNLWTRAIEKKMKAIGIAFKFQGPAGKRPVGHQEIKCHLVFDIKLDFTRKVRFVAGGHMTELPAMMTYALVVSISTLNQLQSSLNDSMRIVRDLDSNQI